MAEDIEVPEAEGEKVETPAKEKVFTQAEVNKLISKEKAALTSRHTAELETVRASLIGLEGVLEKEVAGRVKDLPEFEQKILAKLPLLEQWELLGGEELKVSKKHIPPTEKNDKNIKPEEESRHEAYNRFKK